MVCIARFLRDEEAVSSHEYAVILALIVLALMGTVHAMGTRHGGLWADIMAYLRAAGFLK